MASTTLTAEDLIKQLQRLHPKEQVMLMNGHVLSFGVFCKDLVETYGVTATNRESALQAFNAVGESLKRVPKEHVHNVVERTLGIKQKRSK